MNLKLPASVQVKGPSGETIEVSANEVIEHVVRTGRALGASNEVEGVRTGSRIMAALTGAELADADLTKLKEALAKPSRGWASIGVDVSGRVPVSEKYPDGVATMTRYFTPSAIDLLPLIDALLAL